MCLTEWLALYTGASVLTVGTITWLFFRAVYRPHPTLKSAETIRLLTATVSRLKEQNRKLELERSELEITVYTLSLRVQRLQHLSRSEELP